MAHNPSGSWLAGAEHLFVGWFDLSGNVAHDFACALSQVLFHWNPSLARDGGVERVPTCLRIQQYDAEVRGANARDEQLFHVVQVLEPARVPVSHSYRVPERSIQELLLTSLPDI